MFTQAYLRKMLTLTSLCLSIGGSVDSYAWPSAQLEGEDWNTYITRVSRSGGITNLPEGPESIQVEFTLLSEDPVSPDDIRIHAKRFYMEGLKLTDEEARWYLATNREIYDAFRITGNILQRAKEHWRYRGFKESPRDKKFLLTYEEAVAQCPRFEEIMKILNFQVHRYVYSHPGLVQAWIEQQRLSGEDLRIMAETDYLSIVNGPERRAISHLPAWKQFYALAG